MDRNSLIGLRQYKNKDGILVVESPTFQKANETLAEILYKFSDLKSALFLSGGSSPKRLYQSLANDKKINAGAVGLIDERFGKKDHRHSNELMIRNTGLIDYFENKNTRFYPVLQKDLNIEDTALQYDEALRFVLEYFPRNIGILGIGVDGHTAGLPSGTQKSKLKSQNAKEIIRNIMEDGSGFVDHYELEGYGQRITMNFHALSMLDLILILVLGREKREALRMMFEDGEIEEVPARFYKKPEIAKKTILITDQIV
jgi:6-phosphogluconolactonase/glucosamine-6-phosphate isomerase/deaminase